MATRKKNKIVAAAAIAAITTVPNYFLPILGVAALAVVDQLTKAIIRGNLFPSVSINLPISLGLLQIVHIGNTGAIFGVLKGTQLMISALSIAVVAFLVIIYRKLDKKFLRLGALLIIAGAVGNTIDRLAFGRVTDFIYVRPWPAFNLADSFLFFGAALLLLSFIRLRQQPSAVAAKRSRKRKNRKQKK